jgi:hypothetical protein
VEPCPGLVAALAASSPGISVNDTNAANVIFFELCAGSAKLSHSVSALGIQSVAVDWHRNKHHTWHPVISIDLSDPIQCMVLLEFLQSCSKFILFVALPCGTCSRARDIKLQGVKHLPQPLRSETHPRGLPSLEGSNLSRVLKANCIYDNVFVIILYCISVGAAVCIENPSRSWLWHIPEYEMLLQSGFTDV